MQLGAELAEMQLSDLEGLMVKCPGQLNPQISCHSCLFHTTYISCPYIFGPRLNFVFFLVVTWDSR